MPPAMSTPPTTAGDTADGRLTPEPGSPAGEVMRRTRVGVFLSVVTGIFTRLIGLLTTLILAHYMTPEQSGSVNLALNVVNLISVVTTIGLGQYVASQASPSPKVAWNATQIHLITGLAAFAITYFGGAVKFSQPITQFGLTASRNGTQYITVWNTNGQMIGQVTWQPNNDAAFVGIDTNGVPIGMLTYGNDNLWAGGSYDIGGSTIISDHWIWALGVPCQSDADCMDDDNPCTLTQCSNGACLYPADPQGICPDDGNLCTTDECQNGACIHWDNNDPCDDADACTDFDTCDNGECNGVDIECNDANLCSVDSCDSMIGCVNEFQPGCCLSDADCPEGQICLLGSNSCIPDPNPDTGSDTSTDTTTEGTTDTTSESTSESGDTSESSGSGESGGDSGTSVGEGNDELGGLDTFGGVEPEDGCGCTTDQRGGGALASLFGLALLAGVRRRRDPQ